MALALSGAVASGGSDRRSRPRRNHRRWARRRSPDTRARETSSGCGRATPHPSTASPRRPKSRSRRRGWPPKPCPRWPRGLRAAPRGANLLEGVRLDADVELQFVGVGHLSSLPFGFESVNKELRRLHGASLGTTSSISWRFGRGTSTARGQRHASSSRIASAARPRAEGRASPRSTRQACAPSPSTRPPMCTTCRSTSCVTRGPSSLNGSKGEGSLPPTRRRSPPPRASRSVAQRAEAAAR
jgi:hypothetical protein